MVFRKVIVKNIYRSASPRGLTTLELCFATLGLLTFSMALIDIYSIIQAQAVLDEALSQARQRFVSSREVEDGSVFSQIRERAEQLLPIKGISCTTPPRSSAGCCSIDQPGCLDGAGGISGEQIVVTLRFHTYLLILPYWRGLLQNEEERALFDGIVGVHGVVAVNNSAGPQGRPAIRNREPEED